MDRRSMRRNVKRLAQLLRLEEMGPPPASEYLAVEESLERRWLILWVRRNAEVWERNPFA